MSGYRHRIVDIELDELRDLPAISLEGPKAVGKTETAARRANTTFDLDNPETLAIIEADPNRLVNNGEPPVFIDEWQRYPPSWDLVRRQVDADSSARFLLAGSAAPVETPLHSGAGRIVTVQMRPMSLAERGLGEPTVKLSDLLDDSVCSLSGSTELGLSDYTDEILRSGFPAIRHATGRALRTQLDGYIDRVVERDFEEVGVRVRNTEALRRWMTSYAAATSTTTSFEKIRDAASAGEETKQSKTTTGPYRTALERLHLMESLPAWAPSRNHLRNLTRAPAHHLADPALAARLLGASSDTLLDGKSSGPAIPRDGTLLGALFEALVVQSVRVYAQANEAQVFHLRTRGGEREVDIIVRRPDGRIVALEVKLSSTPKDSDFRHLRWLKKSLGEDLLDAIVVTTGSEAYRRTDGFGVVPAALLTA